MGKASREKGKRGEREVVNLLKDYLGDDYDFKRNLLGQCRDGGMDVLGLEGWAIEVKNYANVTPSNIQSWWEQTCEEAQIAQCQPVLFWKQTRRPWVVVVAGTHLIIGSESWGRQYDFTLSMSVEMFCCLVRENMA
jgi:Holliday junction resolvase